MVVHGVAGDLHKFGPAWAKPSRVPPALNRNRPVLGRWPLSANLGPMYLRHLGWWNDNLQGTLSCACRAARACSGPDVGQVATLASVGKQMPNTSSFSVFAIRAKFGTLSPIFAPTWPNRARIGPNHAELGQPPLNLVKLGAQLAKFEQTLSNMRRVLPRMAGIGTVDQPWPKAGATPLHGSGA